MCLLFGISFNQQFGGIKKSLNSLFGFKQLTIFAFDFMLVHKIYLQ